MTDMEQLIAAAGAGDNQEVANLLDENPHLVSQKDRDGATALHWAALNGHRTTAELLIDLGADVNSRDAVYDATPAGWAIEYLREKGALLRIELSDFAHAIRQGDAHWVARWLQRFPVLRTANADEGLSFLELAAQSPNKEIQKLFEEID
jgi:ankyrin repeat protein